MIRFEGTISKEGEKHVLKQYFTTMVLVGLVGIILGTILLIVLLVLNASDKLLMFGIIAVIVFYALAILFGVCWPLITKNQQLPTKVEIEDDYITCFYSGSELYGKSRYSNVEHIKKIVDNGEFFYFYFYYPHKIIGCICQKDLIVEGTIEEFEKLFEGKIIRKLK